MNIITKCLIFGDRTPKKAVQAKIAELEQRKQKDPITNYRVIEKDGEYILEFIVSDNNNEELNTVEVDIHHYKQMNINGKTASVLWFYSCRAYGDDIMSFIKSIPNKRIKWYESMIGLKLNTKFPNCIKQ